VSAPVCLTIDVEDWYDGMAVLGHPVPRPPGTGSGLGRLLSILEPHDVRVTLFTVGNYAATVLGELRELLAAGHEIASHGPDHGRLPEDPKALVGWLRRGRQMLEDELQTPIRGFRSPRFDVPASMDLASYRTLVAEAGFGYTSDTSSMDGAPAVAELPVLMRGRLPIGGGSYQRLLPRSMVDASVRASPTPAVCYYHSYDFGTTLPPLRSVRTLAVAKQVVVRKRIATTFERLLTTYGSKACSDVASPV